MYNMSNYPLTVLEQYKEYLDISKFYINSKTTSIPIRYLNINLEMSTYDEKALLTFDKFRSNLTGIVYDVYEFTPAIYTSPILNATTNEQDKDFTRFSSIVNIQIHTIPKVYIGDLVHFYTPNAQKTTLYRVVNFRVPLNNFDKLPVYELDLEPAPTITENYNDNILASLNINRKYIYDYSIEKYIDLPDFTLRTKISNIFSEQYKEYFYQKINHQELFECVINDNTCIVYEINKWLYETITEYNSKFHHIDLYTPFGFINLEQINNIIDDYKTLNKSGGVLHIFTNNEYQEINIEPININFDQINIDQFNLDDYNTDIEKIIVFLYLFDRLRELS